MTKGECQAITNLLERTKTHYLLDSNTLVFKPLNNTDFTRYFTYLPKVLQVLMARAGGDAEVMAFVESLTDVNSALITIAEHRKYFADFEALLEYIDDALAIYAAKG